MADDRVLLIVEELFKSWYSSVLRYAWRVSGSLELAEDVVQEAFVCLCRDLHAGHAIDSPKGWTLKVVHRLLYKGMGYERSLVSIGSPELDGLPALQVEADFTGDLELDEVTNLFSVLTPREEEVVLLRMQAMKYREIGETLGIRPQTVHVLLNRALVELRRALEPERQKSDVPKTH